MKHLPQHINCKIIPHKSQRYDTCGDYEEFSKTCWNVSISRHPLGWRAEALVLIHELIEMMLCRHRGISWDSIDEFDMAHPELDDPGSCKRAPYHREHVFAVRVEKMMCLLFGFDWDTYDKSFAKMRYPKHKEK